MESQERLGIDNSPAWYTYFVSYLGNYVSYNIMW